MATASTCGVSPPFPPFAWNPLRRRLAQAERRALAEAMRGLLQFQREIARFRLPRTASDATAFVSLYANGRLCGCYGSDEGEPAERLGRAFLRAAHDGRFDPLSRAERDVLVAQISYLRKPVLLNPETAVDEIEVGTHGLALVRDRLPPVLLLPHVARDWQTGPRDWLLAIANKARVAPEQLGDGALYRFETEDVMVGRSPGTVQGAATGADSAAGARWLASLVDADDRVTFAVDPRSGHKTVVGEMHHPRAAVLARALAAHGQHRKVADRVRARLVRDARAALGGATVQGWPRRRSLRSPWSRLRGIDRAARARPSRAGGRFSVACSLWAAGSTARWTRRSRPGRLLRLP